jgi:transposase-like protein
MLSCPTCHQPATSRDGRDRRGQQRYVCRPCDRDFTATSTSVFSGYRWPPEVILTAVRWYLSYPLSARRVTELLAERGIDVSPRTVLNWTQAFGPQLAVAARAHGGGWAGAGTSTRCSSSAAPRSGTSIGLSISTAR